MSTTIIIYRGLSRIDAGCCGVMLNTGKACQLRYIIEHMVRTVESHTRIEKGEIYMIEEKKKK